MGKGGYIISIALAALLVLAWVCSCGQGSLEQPLSPNESEDMNAKLDFTLVSLSGEPRLEVKLSFVMPRDRLALRLPNQFLRKARLFERIEMLDTLGVGEIIDSNLPNKKILEAPAGSKITLRYFLRGNSTEEDKREAFSSPIVDNDYFQFAGSMGLVVPIAFFNNETIPLRMEWHVSPSYRLYNSFGVNETRQDLNISANALLDGFYTGGAKIRSYQETVDGKPVTIILEGHWQHIDDFEFVDLVTKLLEEQRQVWQDDDFPSFLISFVALGSGCSTNQEARFGGTAHVNSFRAYYPTDCPMKPEMVQLISHELMHMWIGKKIKVGQMAGGYDGKWFTEGFTDFYGRIMAYRAGLFSETTYFKTFNAILEKYFTSNERMISLSNLVKRIYKKYLTNRELENIPYQQGEIMAAILNMEIQKRSDDKYSLDDVIKDLLRDANENGGSKTFSLSELEKAFDKYVPGEFTRLFKKVVRGEELYPPHLPGCSSPIKLNYTSFQGNQSRQFSAKTNILTYRRLKRECSKWLR